MTRRQYLPGDRVVVRDALGSGTAHATVTAHEGPRVHVRYDKTGTERDVSYTRVSACEPAATR